MNNRPGFTLIEILTAFAVLLTMTISLHLLLMGGKNTLTSAYNQRQALYIAQNEMEKLLVVPFSELPNYDSKIFANGKGHISIKSVFSDLYQIKIELTWSTAKKPISFITLRSNY